MSTSSEPQGSYIGGTWMESAEGNTLTLVNPSTMENRARSQLRPSKMSTAR